MSFVTAAKADPKHLAWPEIPPEMNAIQIIAIARIVERVCGNDAAASYLAEAVIAFNKKPTIIHTGYLAPYAGPSDEGCTDADPTSLRQHATHL